MCSDVASAFVHRVRARVYLDASFEGSAVIRATVSGGTVTAFRVSAAVVHAFCFVSREVCNLCAPDNPRASKR